MSEQLYVLRRVYTLLNLLGGSYDLILLSRSETRGKVQAGELAIPALRACLQARQEYVTAYWKDRDPEYLAGTAPVYAACEEILAALDDGDKFRKAWDAYAADLLEQVEEQEGLSYQIDPERLAGVVRKALGIQGA